MPRVKSASLPIEREKKIVEILKSKKIIHINDLHNIFNVTKMTLWRDIQNLMQKYDNIKSVHGGIMLIEDANDEIEDSMEQRKKINAENKAIIAQKAADLIQEGQTIILDASSSSYYLAQEISNKENICVITNCIDIAHMLQKNECIEVVVSGGHLKRETSSLIGPQAKNFFSRIKADICFFSVSGVSPSRELMDINPLEIEVKLAMIKAARKSVLLLDSAKLDSPRGIYSIMKLKEVDHVISDRKMRKH